MGWSDVRHHYEDGDPEDAWPDHKVLTTGAHTARKPHPCMICEGSIMPGERYRKVVALLDGKFIIDCTHEDGDACRAMAKQVDEWRRAESAEMARAFAAEMEAEHGKQS